MRSTARRAALEGAGNPEHISDLESRAVVRVEVRLGDAADNDDSLCERVMEVVATLSEVVPEEALERLGVELGADEGCFALEPIGELRACGERTVITDPQTGRRKRERLSADKRSVLLRAATGW